jgi:hypothetical protein
MGSTRRSRSQTPGASCTADIPWVGTVDGCCQRVSRTGRSVSLQPSALPRLHQPGLATPLLEPRRANTDGQMKTAPTHRRPALPTPGVLVGAGWVSKQTYGSSNDLFKHGVCEPTRPPRGFQLCGAAQTALEKALQCACIRNSAESAAACLLPTSCRHLLYLHGAGPGEPPGGHRVRERRGPVPGRSPL